MSTSESLGAGAHDGLFRTRELCESFCSNNDEDCKCPEYMRAFALYEIVFDSVQVQQFAVSSAARGTLFGSRKDYEAQPCAQADLSINFTGYDEVDESTDTSSNASTDEDMIMEEPRINGNTSSKSSVKSGIGNITTKSGNLAIEPRRPDQSTSRLIIIKYTNKELATIGGFSRPVSSDKLDSVRKTCQNMPEEYCGREKDRLGPCTKALR